MRKLNKFEFILITAISFLFLFTTNKVHAAKVGGIAIEPVYASNQITKNGFLNPKVKPGAYQDFEMNVLSMSNKSQDVTIKPHTAYTSEGISISYDKDKIINTSNLQYDFRSLFKNKSLTFKLPAGSAYKIRFRAKIPEKSFSGLIMGGFYITTNDSIAKGQDTGTTITNKYSYVMPAILNEDGAKAVPKLSLGNIETKGKFVNSKIYNKRPSYINSMSIYSKITDSDNKTVSEYESKDNSVAPNSHFNVTNLVYSGAIRPGNYHIKIVAKSTDPYKWVMEKDFSVSSSQYIGYIIGNNQWIIYIILLLMLIILLLIIILFKRRRKNKQEDTIKK
ncbi:WxL protein host-binding domain-containing protein [Apilactobacillus xinyiensis]|uniref:DUF916 and DUF3324 domain-containing protein n=1 Tax=Apilactobacillus xinyiensis TaxID=2841032 RepID=A0ABT0I398_9LACO|nr:DUF3324 domain-containing protein [Apilactobacillus xinyiensis]MCK8625162.1 DUF916 and DUF3324 domain-containing protein [Apilactobacillus xinyiensis]MCL0330378.1 DUF916 and DUF3324 domain-containing protein [Apilactobacillus xinyiensis]